MAGCTELALLLLLGAPEPPPATGYCVDCHAKEKEPRLHVPTASVAKSVHATLDGLCAACHGGDPREPTKLAHDPKRGFRGKPSPREIPAFCGGCHADAAFMRRRSASIPVDQLALHRVSRHGIALAEGMENVAVCTSCHGAHDVVPVKNPKSPVYPTNVARTCGHCHSDTNHPASRHSRHDPVKLWKASVHAAAMFERNDLSAPTCNDCHGDHGAAPPGIRDIHNACGACHAEQSERFAKSPHAEAFARLGFGECDECHARHQVEPASDEMLLPGEGHACTRCHAEGEKAAEVAKQLKNVIDQVRQEGARAAAEAEKARRAGLLIPIADAAEHDLKTSLSKMRIAVHDMKLASLEPELRAARAATSSVAHAAEAAQRELALRRRGYQVFIGLIGVMIGLLGVKIRRLS